MTEARVRDDLEAQGLSVFSEVIEQDHQPRSVERLGADHPIFPITEFTQDDVTGAVATWHEGKLYIIDSIDLDFDRSEGEITEGICDSCTRDTFVQVVAIDGLKFFHCHDCREAGL